MVQSVQAMQGTRRTDPLALLGDGLGLAADDMTPGSGYLAMLNARQRRDGVPYHILAGDVGYLNADARRQVEARLNGRGVLGGVGRMLTSGASASLDEITDGLGDGCVSVASTRLAGVADHRTLHANHLELIRAPLLFPDPGPVASMPDLLRWLGEDRRSIPRVVARVLGIGVGSVNLVARRPGSILSHLPVRPSKPVRALAKARASTPRIRPMTTFAEPKAPPDNGDRPSQGASTSFSAPRCGSGSAITGCGRCWSYLPHKHLNYARKDALAPLRHLHRPGLPDARCSAAILADKFLGQRKAILIGGIVMALGHFAMAFESMLHLALGLLMLGNGFFKPNISTMVGNLYPQGDARRDGAYTIFYMGINLGAFLAPLVCGTLGENPDRLALRLRRGGRGDGPRPDHLPSSSRTSLVGGLSARPRRGGRGPA